MLVMAYIDHQQGGWWPLQICWTEIRMFFFLNCGKFWVVFCSGVQMNRSAVGSESDIVTQ